MKKTIFIMLSLSLILAVVTSSCKQEAKGEASGTNDNPEEIVEPTSAEEVPVQASPRMESSGKVDGVNINIDYGSPSVKGREIWGGLEPYGKVWRAGANETTNIEFSADVMVNGKPLVAGKYGFFLIPIEGEEWIAIFNEEWSRELHGAWGAFGYKQEKDVLRIDVSPEWADEVMEQLTYTVVKNGFEFGWEKARISFEVKSK
jgi:hypothetical protein